MNQYIQCLSLFKAEIFFFYWVHKILKINKGEQNREDDRRRDKASSKVNIVKMVKEMPGCVSVLARMKKNVPL